MPKVSKKGEASLLVEAAPMAIDRSEEAAEPSGREPLKPQFPPLNAFDQSGRKIEFRRVSFSKVPRQKRCLIFNGKHISCQKQRSRTESSCNA